MRLNLIFLIVLLGLVFPSSCQVNSNKTEQKLLEEFELINLCHCQEYLQLRDYDYIKWKYKDSKQKQIEEDQYLKFVQYKSSRQFNLYYQKRYDSTLFYKNGISIWFERGELNFNRLDSLYYEPIVQHYVKKISRTENLPYLGLGDVNFIFDCYQKVKEIPLKKELELFRNTNKPEVEVNK